jgi:peptidyl-prolyl cis-trans isomerase SurA
MNLRNFCTPAAFVFSTVLLASSALAQATHPAVPDSPYGGTTVEEIVARVNDQIITRSDYDRTMKELDAEARQHGSTMQEISNAHKDLLRNLIDQQLWLSKGKELSINGETELIKKLDELRKQYHLDTLEDLEKSAREQGVSYEDFKANIRNQIITQLVMRQEIGRKIQFTPGEAERYFEQHKKEYAQPESVTLAEILISTTSAAPSVTGQSGAQPDDPATLAAAKAKADDLEAKLHAGGDFSQLARTFSDGTTAAEGGDLGQFQRGALAKILEDKTFALKSGEITEPIRTKQGYVILKVLKHVTGGIPVYKDVMDEVENNFYMSRMEPAMRDYLTTMREQAYIDIKPGYSDSGASPNEKTSTIKFSAYTPPAPKKKKVERTRFRENTRTFRQKQSSAAPPPEAAAPVTSDVATAKKGKKNKSADQASTKSVKKSKKGKKSDQASMKMGKKEKIRYGKAPTKTLPSAPQAPTEDAGAVQPQAEATPEPVNPLEASNKPTEKTRYSARAKVAKQAKVKAKGPKTDAQAPVAADSAEVADRQTQAGPLGLAGDTSSKKKKKVATTTGDKTRLADQKKKKKAAEQNTGDVPLGNAPQPQK